MKIDYSRLYTGNYLRLLVLPVLLFFVFVFLVFFNPGIKQGIDLTGGTLLTIRTDKDIDAHLLEVVLKKEFSLEGLKVVGFSSPTSKGVMIQYSFNTDLKKARELVDNGKQFLDSNPAKALDLFSLAESGLSGFLSENFVFDDPVTAVDDAEEMLSQANENFQEKLQRVVKKEFSLSGKTVFQKREIGAQLGSVFWEAAFNVSLISIFLLVVSIFVFFKKFLPSLAIIGAAVFDVLGALSGMAVTGVPLSVSTIPALLMLVGYSVDTDIMLTSRLLRERDALPAESAFTSLKTGLTMTLTSLMAMLVILVLSFFNQMFVMFEISSVIFFGLLADIVSTWFMNAPVLVWYVEKFVRREGV